MASKINLNHAGLLVVLGIALYLRWPDSPAPYLWLDEAWRAYGVSAQLQGQVLLLSELALSTIGLAVLGPTELAFRIWPLLFSLLALVGAYLFLRRVSSPTSALCATFLMATGSGFVSYSREFKPYALDLALTAWTLFVVAKAASDDDRRADLILCLLLVVFALSSVTFAFVFPAVLLYRYWGRWPTRLAEWVRPLLPAAVFSLAYVFFLRPQAGEGRIVKYWSHHFANSVENLIFLAADAKVSIDSFFSPGWVVALACYFVLLPAISIYRRDRVWVLLVFPFAVQAAMSALGLYPLFSRVSYYLYGLMTIGFGYVVGAVPALVSIRRRGLRPVLEITVLALLMSGVWLSGRLEAHVKQGMSWPVDQGRETFAALAENYRPGDVVKVSYGAHYTFEFYKPVVFAGVEELRELPLSWKTAIRDNNMTTLCRWLKWTGGKLSRGDRVWYVSAHTSNAHRYYQALLHQVGDVRVVVEGPHQSLVRFDVKEPLAGLSCPG